MTSLCKGLRNELLEKQRQLAANTAQMQGMQGVLQQILHAVSSSQAPYDEHADKRQRR